jgi:hypothetical protein
LEKIKGWRKIQNGGQKPKWRRIVFFNRNSTETPSSALLEKKIDANLLRISCFILKSRFGILKFDKMAEKFKMASET